MSGLDQPVIRRCGFCSSPKVGREVFSSQMPERFTEDLSCGPEGTQVDNAAGNVNPDARKRHPSSEREVQILRPCGCCLMEFLNLDFKGYVLPKESQGWLESKQVSNCDD